MSALAIDTPIVDATIDLTHAEARALTDRIVGVVTDLVDLVRQAWEGRAWAALDYPSWEAYLEAEIGTALAGLPKSQRRDVVGVLRDSGMSPRAIAPVVGVGSAQTISADLRLVRPDGVGPSRGRDGKLYTVPAAIETAPTRKGAVKTTTALELLEQAGPDGLTIPELMRRKRWSYGQASATLSRLHAQLATGSTRRIERLATWRGGYSVYVAPEHVGDRALLSPGQRRSARA